MFYTKLVQYLIPFLIISLQLYFIQSILYLQLYFIMFMHHRYFLVVISSLLFESEELSEFYQTLSQLSVALKV